MHARLNRRHLALGLLATAAAGLTGCATAPAAPAGDRLVIQVSDAEPAKWNLALNNARNAQNEVGLDKLQVEIVAFGPGIGMLRDDAVVANRVAEAVQSGVSVVACENTMAAQKLERSQMHPRVGYVPAGVVQIMRRQQQGWAYLRP